MCHTMNVLATILILLSSTAAYADGTLELVNIPSPSLSNSIVDIHNEREIAVYLPPSYQSSDSSYPVVYLLCGYGGEVTYWTTGIYQNFRLPESIDTLIDEGAVDEMILVIVSGTNIFGGSFYVDSTVTGNWKTHILSDVVGYVDAHYRTIPQAASRGITGFSMGGFGALNIAMRHPDMFSAIYALSPGLYDENGLENSQIFPGPTTINRFIDKETELAGMERDESLTALKKYIDSRNSIYDFDTQFSYAYGMAFSPNPDINAPFTNYPFTREDSVLVKNETYWNNYESGFGNVREETAEFHGNLLSLSGIVIDYGTRDEYKWIREGCEYYSDILDEAGISHELKTFTGGHGDRNRFRLEDHILPFFSGKLSRGVSVDKTEEKRTEAIDLRQNHPNPFNGATAISFRLNETAPVRLAIHSITGQDVAVLHNGRLNAGSYTFNWHPDNLASGVYICNLTAGIMHQCHRMTYMK